jgi:hypothetical protein
MIRDLAAMVAAGARRWRGAMPRQIGPHHHRDRADRAAMARRRATGPCRLRTRRWSMPVMSSQRYGKTGYKIT